MQHEEKVFLDYQKLGLKCGLEVHQQLDTKKLFCDCPSILRQDEPDFTIKRKLHAVAGESGEVDQAASYQASLGKEFIYQGYYDNTCLIELDEEPPHELNKDALKIALQISEFLNCKPYPITQIMRKTVIDGSNTSGFQRTLIISHNGYVKTAYGKVGIQSISLEEDAARIIKNEKDKTIFRLDRLGIPLVEIATAPDIKNPEQAKEVALFIGEVLRACKVKRGIGTIRQDVNMSLSFKEILGKEMPRARMEIKGVQEPQLIIKTINYEIERQLELIKQKKKIFPEVRRALENGKTEFLRPMPGADRMYPETDLSLLKISRELVNEVKRTMPKLKTEYEEELRKKGLNNEMIKLVLDEDKVEVFKELINILDNPNLVAKTLLLYPKEIASHAGVSIDKVEKILNKDIIALILEILKKGKIIEAQIKDVMNKLIQGMSFEEAIQFEKKDMNEIEEAIMKMIKEKPGLSENAYMGLVMSNLDLRGKIDGKSAKEIIKKLMK